MSNSGVEFFVALVVALLLLSFWRQVIGILVIFCFTLLIVGGFTTFDAVRT